jgi:ubiquinone/menaquinone biosynthesis C-methylase UbiE
MKPNEIKQLQHEPNNLGDLQESYDRLYQGWMGKHKNIAQANLMLSLLKVQPGQSLADIGCGLGYTLDMAAERGLNAVGIDISVVALQQAKKENRYPTNVLLGEAEHLPFPKFAFDYVMILGSLEHFLDLPSAVREAARILKPEGRAAILVPNSHHIRSVYNVYKHGEVVSDAQDFERVATRKEWERLFYTNGLNILSVHKYDIGMARAQKKGSELFWYFYNIMFRLLGNRWIPLNLTYTFIFICKPSQNAVE